LGDSIALLVDIFSSGFLALVTTFDPSYIPTDPIFIAVLVVLGFVVGSAIGASGIGGAALIVPVLIFLGLSPQSMVGASLFFNFFSNILGTVLHSKKRNINWRALIYVFIPAIPSMFLASQLWVYIKTNYGSITLDTFILLPIGILLVSIAGFMIKSYGPWKKDNLDSEGQGMDLKRNLGRRDKCVLMCTGGFVSFMIQISSVGAGVIVTPVLLKVIRSPRHAAGTTVTFGLVVSFIGTLLHYTFGTVPIYLVVFLLVGSIPGIILGVRITTIIPPRKLSFLFAIIILAAGLLILNQVIPYLFS
jgi:uncharacterized membrane protein YfcA